MNQLTITYLNDEVTVFRDVDHFDFISNYLVITFADLKTRKVVSLAQINEYEYKGQPVVTNTPPKKKKK